MEVVNRDRSAPFLTKDRSEIRSILDRTNSTATNQSLAEATLPPGAETEEHLHPRTEEIYYVLRGRGLMTLEGERREVWPGDGILIPPGTRQWRGQCHRWGRGDSTGRGVDWVAERRDGIAGLPVNPVRPGVRWTCGLSRLPL